VANCDRLDLEARADATKEVRHRDCEETPLMNAHRRIRGMAGLLLLLAAASCHNTAQGVKEDTKRALDKTGAGLEKAGDKIDGHRRDDR
jgi:predicted small secreted protein